MQSENRDCGSIQTDILNSRSLYIVSNRGPVTIHADDSGENRFQRSGGGLVTALLELAKSIPSTWIAAAMGEEDRAWKEGDLPLGEGEEKIHVQFVPLDQEVYDGYYQTISNPLLWFLQHSLWDFANAPTINRDTWKAWNDGYVAANKAFADAVVDAVQRDRKPALVMLQDYHLYLTPRFIRNRLRIRRNLLLTHFIHIPWPGPEDWGLLPGKMREAILDGLCALDLVGFQTSEDALNFIRTCESLLPGAQVNYRRGWVEFRNHVTHVRDFPISIDVDSVCAQSETEEVAQFREQIADLIGERKMILRIERTEPSKNIVRGFQAYDEMLETHPEHQHNVQFVAIMVPSRLEVEEYQGYLDKIMAAAGNVNAHYGTPDWEPVRVLVGESYPRALAAMQLYDVLLVNPVADGMNLVAKEGPVVNHRDGVVVLSERAGAHQQLGEHALVIAPVDVSATAEALHNALTMQPNERARRAQALRMAVEREDIHLWLCWQMDAIRGMLQRAREKKK